MSLTITSEEIGDLQDPQGATLFSAKVPLLCAGQPVSALLLAEMLTSEGQRPDAG
jgi:hypothetical protein